MFAKKVHTHNYLLHEGFSPRVFPWPSGGEDSAPYLDYVSKWQMDLGCDIFFDGGSCG
jgi:hypothetical protein